MTGCTTCCSTNAKWIGFGVLLAAAVAVGFNQGDEKPKPAVFKGDPYTLETCPVSGEKLGSMGAPVVKAYDGREVRFCCNGCVGKFEANKDAAFAKIDEQLVEQQLKHYPLKSCVVMEDELLDSSDEGEPVNLVYRNRLVRFCCKGCVRDFNGDPAKYIAKLDAAVVKQQEKAYPLETCPVSGEKLGSMGTPVNLVVGTTLVRLCCNGCKGPFNLQPAKYIAMVHEGWKSKHSHDHDHGHSHDHGHDHDH